ncbi:MAG: GNAT family N-acetyltransferase [Oscillospiraceae bacterium]|nr:GNAT family N-acetyltransferase [Oscillospiraceae bacterium]
MQQDNTQYTITLRDAQIDDAQAIWKLNDKVFGYEYPLETTRKQLAQLLKNPFYRFFVVCVEDKVVGYAQAADYDSTYGEPMKNIMAIAVDEAYQGCGAGRALLQAVEAWSRQSGCAGVRLVSGFDRQKAHGFYAHCGYEHRKDQKNFTKKF